MEASAGCPACSLVATVFSWFWGVLGDELSMPVQTPAVDDPAVGEDDPDVSMWRLALLDGARSDRATTSGSALGSWSACGHRPFGAEWVPECLPIGPESAWQVAYGRGDRGGSV